jgi:hypothetical protein
VTVRPEVLQGAQGLGEAELAHRIQLEGSRLRRARDDAHLEPAFQPLEVLDVLHDLAGLGGLPVQPGEALLVAAEELAALPLLHLGHESRDHAVVPGGEVALDDAPDLRRVQRLLQARSVEIEDEQADRAEVGRGREVDGPELAPQLLAQLALDLVGVPDAREGDGQGHVALAAARVHGDLVVPGHVDDAVDDVLQAGGRSVEQLALGEAVEEGADLPVDVAVLDVPAMREQPVVFLLQERDVRRLLGEGDLGQAAEEDRRFPQLARGPPFPHDDVVERVHVVEGGRVVREVDVHDARVFGRGLEPGLDLLHEVREHDGQQALVREGAQGALRDAVELAVRGEAVAHAAQEDEVLVQHPHEERARGLHPAQALRAVAQLLAEVARRPLHLLVVLDGGEDGLQYGEDLVLDAAQPFLGLDALDLEVAVQLLGPVLLRAAHPHRPLPLPAHGEDLVDGGEDAQPRLAEVVLQALEDERGVEGVGLDDRRLQGHPVRGAHRRRFFLVRVARGDVDAGKAFVELDRVRDLAGDEAERREHARGQGLDRQVEGDAVGHPGEHDGREGKNEVAVLGRGATGEDPLELLQAGSAPRGIGGDHSVPILSQGGNSLPTERWQ